MSGNEIGESFAKLASALVAATMIPSVHETVTLLEYDLKTPTSGRFYPYGTLLNRNRLASEYPEFVGFTPNSTLPTMVGNLELKQVLMSEQGYINPILQRSGQAGYRTAWVMVDGIIFYLHIFNMGVTARGFYQNFFLNRKAVYMRIKHVIIEMLGPDHDLSEILRVRINGQPMNQIILKFPYSFTPKQIQLINYEMSHHYQKMNFTSEISCEQDAVVDLQDLETPIEPTTLKIKFQLKKILQVIQKEIDF